MPRHRRGPAATAAREVTASTPAPARRLPIVAVVVGDADRRWARRSRDHVRTAIRGAGPLTRGSVDTGDGSRGAACWRIALFAGAGDLARPCLGGLRILVRTRYPTRAGGRRPGIGGAGSRLRDHGLVCRACDSSEPAFARHTCGRFDDFNFVTHAMELTCGQLPPLRSRGQALGTRRQGSRAGASLPLRRMVFFTGAPPFSPS